MTKWQHLSSTKQAWLVVVRWAILLLMLLTCLWATWQYRARQWDGRLRFTVISFEEDQLKIRSFDPQLKTGREIVFPANLEIDTVLGRGRWPVASLDRAGTIRWAADSVAQHLGIAYTETDKHLSYWDRLSWSLWSAKIVWQTVELDQTTLVIKRTAPDGTEIYQISPMWDQKAQEWFVSQVIAAQGYQARVVNTTPVSGLGSQAARILESMGVKVVEVVSGESVESRCVVVTEVSLRKSEISRELQRIFGCGWKEGEGPVLELRLGQDYQERIVGAED